MADVPALATPRPARPSFGRRRAVVAAVSLVVAVVLGVAGGHGGAHALQNLVVPGIGLYERSLVLAIAVFVLTVAAVVLWVQWGVDWLLAVVVLGSTVAAGTWGNVSGVAAGAAGAGAAAAVRRVPAAHEFPLVVLVVSGVVWVRGALGHIPGVRHLVERRRRARPDALHALDRSRTAVVLGLLGDPDAGVLATDPSVERRARRIGLMARGRRGADPFARDHAAARAGLSLAGASTPDAIARFRDDAARAAAGVPASEPTWVRPLDAVLAAVALHHGGDPAAGPRAAEALAGPLALRHGHRPACWWTPLGIRFGSAPVWEHAATAALARTHGWCDDADWTALRARLLGAAARGVGRPDDERAIAAGRIWLAFVDDEQAARILRRPTVSRDPLAVALDRYASRLVAERKDLVA
ncbi:MAG: hypothetical protein U0Q03_05780 [Acidimicrobiales bacterium]